MLAILITSLVFSIGIIWLAVDAIRGKVSKYGAWQYFIGIGAFCLLFTLAIQAANRFHMRADIVKLEATRRTIESMPKDKMENTGIYQVIIEKNEWLAIAQLENTWYWIGDLSTDDGITGIKPLSIKEIESLENK